MKIILVRHGEAEEAYISGSDRGRRLTEKGVEDIHKIGNFILHSHLKVVHIYHSPYERTRLTAEILASHLELEEHIHASEDLSAGCDCCRILPDLSPYTNSDAIIIVAHNPDITHFAARLLGSTCESNLLFSPGTTLAVNVPKEKFSQGQILWMVSPDFLSAESVYNTALS